MYDANSLVRKHVIIEHVTYETAIFRRFKDVCEVCLGDLLVEIEYYVYIYIVTGV